MSGPDATATPFIGSDRRSEILDRLAARARATPPETTPQAIASRVGGLIQNQMNEPPGEADEDEGGKYAKNPVKDDQDTKAIKDNLDGRPRKVEKDDKDAKDEPDKQASEKSDDKDEQDTKDFKDSKDSKDNKDNKDKEASDKNQNKDAIDDKNDKDVKDAKDLKDNKENDKDTSDKGDDKEGDKEGDKDTSDKGDDTGTGTFTDDEFVDPASRGQLAEMSADSPPAGGIGRPTSLLTLPPVV